MPADFAEDAPSSLHDMSAGRANRIPLSPTRPASPAPGAQKGPPSVSSLVSWPRPLNLRSLTCSFHFCRTRFYQRNLVR